MPQNWPRRKIRATKSEGPMETNMVRANVLRLLGPLPKRVALHPRIRTAIDEGEYDRARVTYTVEPGERAPTWLLTPHGVAPSGGWPALLVVHQHANQYELGKAEPAGLAGDLMYHYGRELCQRGYVVL